MSNPKAPASPPATLACPAAMISAREPTQDIESMIAAYHATIRRLALSILDDLAEADDAAQETFIAASRAGEGFRGEANLKTWLTAIAVNVCRGRLRKRRIRQRLQSMLQALHWDGGGEPTPEVAALKNEADRRIWQAVDMLDENHRLVIILRYVHELNAEEIVAALGTSAGTVYSRLHYARQKLKVQLDNLTSHVEANDGTP